MIILNFVFSTLHSCFKQNINLTAPIMSRFDLFFILVDECNEVSLLCNHVTCHVTSASPSPR